MPGGGGTEQPTCIRWRAGVGESPIAMDLHATMQQGCFPARETGISQGVRAGFKCLSSHSRAVQARGGHFTSLGLCLAAVTGAYVSPYLVALPGRLFSDPACGQYGICSATVC